MSTTPSPSWPTRPSGWPIAIEHVPADEWDRRARVAGQDADVGALEVVWDAVDSALADLKAAEATLREVRGRP